MRMMSRLALALVVMWAARSARAEERAPYTMEDLRALAEGRGGDDPTSGEAWREAVEHLQDVRPSQRSAKWENIATQAATGYVQGLLAEHKAEEALTAAEELRNKYPHLKRSKAFMAQRARAGLEGFSLCYQHERQPRPPTCNERFLAFIDADPNNAELAMKAGKLVRLNQNHSLATPFFRRALARHKDADECKDEDLQLAVLAGLGLPPDYAQAADARELAGNLCADALTEPIVRKFAEEGGYFKENACALLGKAKGPLAGKCP
jgi:hypothetical protein